MPSDSSLYDGHDLCVRDESSLIVRSSFRALGLFLLVTVVFGTAFPVVKAGLAYIPPLFFSAIRSYIAAAFLLSFMILSRDYWYPCARADWEAIAAGGLFLIGGIGLGFLGQQFITAGVAAIIFSLSPIITAVLAWGLLPNERLTRRDYVGILLGFVGIAVVIRPDPSGLLDPELIGKALLFGGVVIVALGSVLVRRSESTMPLPALTGWSMLVGGTIHVAFGYAIGESLRNIEVTPIAVALVIYLSIVVGAIGLVLYLTLMGEVGVMKASLTTYLTPIVAILIGIILLNEQIHPTAVVGFGIIMAGFAVLESRGIAGELHKYRSLFR